MSKNKKSSLLEDPPSWCKLLFYRFVQFTSRFLGVLFFDFRCLGREHLDLPGSSLILSTHQSHLDPVIVGVIFNERLNYLARRTLFKNQIFATTIRLLDAIELDRDRSGLAGLKETMRRVKKGGKVLMFPEGTRSSDGEIAEIKPGFISVARRTKAPLQPMAIAGAFEAMPKGKSGIRRHPIVVCVGEPISPATIAEIDDEKLVGLVAERLHACRQMALSNRGPLAVSRN